MPGPRPCSSRSCRMTGKRRSPSGRCGIPSMACGARTDEPTSELQPPMRSSYAVFCLKKNKAYKQNKHVLSPVSRQKIIYTPPPAKKIQHIQHHTYNLLHIT